MRTVMATVLVLLAAGYVASLAGSATSGGEGVSRAESTPTGADDDGWRRTARGWERHDQWTRIAPAQLTAPVPKTIHPLALAAAQMLAVVGLWLLTRLVGNPQRDAVTLPIADECDRSPRARATGA